MWWKMHFDNELSELAQDLLSITPISGAAERSWYTFSFIHSKTRNRLQNEKVNMLVYLFSNARLMEKGEPVESGPTSWSDDVEAPENDYYEEEDDDGVPADDDDDGEIDFGVDEND